MVLGREGDRIVMFVARHMPHERGITAPTGLNSPRIRLYISTIYVEKEPDSLLVVQPPGPLEPRLRYSIGRFLMKLFECQHCGQPLYFENIRCESCGRRLGYLPAKETVTALEEVNGGWRALADPYGQYRFCANERHEACNWLIAESSPHEFCAACRHNRMIPDLSAHIGCLRAAHAHESGCERK